MLYRTFCWQLKLKKKTNPAQYIRTCVKNRNSNIKSASGIFIPWKRLIPMQSHTIGQGRPIPLGYQGIKWPLHTVSHTVCWQLWQNFHGLLYFTYMVLLIQPYPPPRSWILQSLCPWDPVAVPILPYPDHTIKNSIRQRGKKRKKKISKGTNSSSPRAPP